MRGYATRGRWRDPLTDKTRNARPWDPILVAGGGVEGGPDGVAQPQDFIHNAARPLNGKIRAAGVPDGNVVLLTEEDFTGPCSESGRIVAADITDSLGGEPAANSTPANPFRLDALSAYHPTQDAPNTTRAERRVLGALLRDFRLDSRRRMVRAGPPPHRRVERTQPAAGRLLLRHGHRSGHESELAVVGRSLAWRTDLPLRHEPWDRDSAPLGRSVHVALPANRREPGPPGGPARVAAGLRLDARFSRLPTLRDSRSELSS